MPIKLPIADTANNRAFQEYVNRLVDGDLFHRRFETPNFIVTMMTHHSVAMTDKGYYESPEESLIALTHKPTGRFSLEAFGKNVGRDRLGALIHDLEKGQESGLINSGIKLIDRLCEGGTETCVGDAYRLYRRRDEEIPEDEARAAFSRLFMPLSEAFEDSGVGAMVKHRWENLSDMEQIMVEKEDGRTPASPIAKLNDFDISRSFGMSPAHSMFTLSHDKGGRDISQAYAGRFGPPHLHAEKPFDVDEIEAQLADIRYNKVRDIVNHARREALELSSLNDIPADMSRKEIKRHIREMYPVIEECCRNASTWWSHFIGQPYTSIRNRYQLLEGPLHRNAKALGALLGNESFRSAIDNGTPLKDELKDLPLFNTSKKSLNSFLNNLSAATRNQGFSALMMNVERGQIRASELRNVEPFSLLEHGDLQEFFKVVAVIQGIPGKYYNDDGTHLQQVLNTPFSRHSLASSICKVRDGEWKAEQAFGWMGKVEDFDNALKINSEVGDTERILTQFYLGTVVSHLMYQSGVDIHLIDHVNEYETIKADDIMVSLASNQPYSSLINLSTTMHHRSHELMKVGAPEGKVGWNPAIAKDYVQDGIIITPIHSTMDMTQEGMILNHCVGTYIKDAMEGRTFIFGVRDADGNRLSTFEVVEDHEEGYRLVQHFAHSNTSPSEKERAVVNAFMEKVMDGHIQMDVDTQVSEDDLKNLSEIARSEILHGLSYSKSEVALEAITQITEMIPSVDIFQVLRDKMNANTQMAESLDQIHEHIDSLEDIYRQNIAKESYQIG